MPPVSQEKPDMPEESHGKMNRADYLCPICLELFLEPVTLPCAHTFCKACFLETVDKANMCCPLCRKRVSTWARHNGRKKTLVNLELWRRIQEAFPTQCQRRLNGIEDEEDIDMFITKPKVSQPGELRQEYEDQISKLVEEKRALEEAESRASEEYIQRLLAEEEERVEEERRRKEQKQLEDDERLARLLSHELFSANGKNLSNLSVQNSSPVMESQKKVRPDDAALAKKKKHPSVGQIEKFLSPVPFKQSNSENSPTSSLIANKENILNAQTPILPWSAETSSLELPASDIYGKPSTSDFKPDSQRELSHTTNSTSFSLKRKLTDTELPQETGFPKKSCESLPVSPHCEDLLLEDLPSQEDFLSRLQQEEEDHRLAQRLQRELDREYEVNRRKGSADGYLLRQKNSISSTLDTSACEESNKINESILLTKACSPRQKVEEDKVGRRTSRAAVKSDGKIPKKAPTSTPTSPIASPGQRAGPKQTTLTAMFPTVGT